LFARVARRVADRDTIARGNPGREQPDVARRRARYGHVKPEITRRDAAVADDREGSASCPQGGAADRRPQTARVDHAAGARVYARADQRVRVGGRVVARDRVYVARRFDVAVLVRLPVASAATVPFRE
jgi:hypothetical protein